MASKPVVIPAAPAPEDGEPITAGDAVPLELQFIGVGDLHRGWFADPAIAGPLSIGLGECMSGLTVVSIRYDEQTRIGRIRLVVHTPASFTCSIGRGTTVSLEPLQPVGRALAAYRDSVAGSFDYRVASFRIELEVRSGLEICELDLAGQFPPDGSTWSPCVNLGGDIGCAGPRDVGVASFAFPDPAHTAYLAGCFTP